MSNLIVFKIWEIITKGDTMKIRLGYVAISLTLGLSASRTLTYKSYQKLGKNEGDKKLDFLLRKNFRELQEILKYNNVNNIHFYRMSPGIVPLATHNEVDFDYLGPYEKDWKMIGDLIKKYNFRVDTHPDQFCVLNSTKKNVLENSINILNYHYQLFKLMKIKGKAILHVGGGFNDKKEAIKRFEKNFNKLKKELQEIIILENDDKTFNVPEVLKICQKLNIPMVLDYHHYLCNNEGEDIRDYLPKIIATWKGENIPKMHFSSPKSLKEKRSHADYINADDFICFIEILKLFNTDIDIMLECKAKDDALFRLVRELKYKTNYKFIDETTFIV